MAPGDQRSRLIVAVSDEHGRPVPGGLARWLARAAPAAARGQVNVAIVSDARVRALNQQYRRRDAATDVLSFPAFAAPDSSAASARQARDASDRRGASARQAHGVSGRRGASAGFSRRPPAPDLQPPASDLDTFLGDIVIARGVARKQAKAAKHPESTEWRVLALHGLLHLLGYDHESDDGTMARVERRLRRRAGLREGLIERVPRR